MSLGASPCSPNQASAHSLTLPIRMDGNALEIRDGVAVTDYCKTCDALFSIFDDKHAGRWRGLGRFDEGEAVEPPEGWKRDTIDLEHGLEIRMVLSRYEVLWCGDGLVETESH